MGFDNDSISDTNHLNGAMVMTKIVNVEGSLSQKNTLDLTACKVLTPIALIKMDVEGSDFILIIQGTRSTYLRINTRDF